MPKIHSTDAPKNPQSPRMKTAEFTKLKQALAKRPMIDIGATVSGRTRLEVLRDLKAQEKAKAAEIKAAVKAEREQIKDKRKPPKDKADSVRGRAK